MVEKRRQRKPERLIRELPEKYLPGEVLPAPTDPVEQRYYQVIQEISQSVELLMAARIRGEIPVITALVITLVYLLYYVAAYRVAKEAVVNSKMR